MRDTCDNGIENFLDALASFARGTDDILAIAADEVDDFVLHLVGHSARHIYFVDDGNNLQVVVDSHVEVRDGLRLHTLCGIDHQQRALAGCYRTADLVREVNMSRGVDEIQDILLAVALILHLNGVTLNGNAAFAFQVHVVEHLTLSHLNGLRVLQQTVGER